MPILNEEVRMFLSAEVRQTVASLSTNKAIAKVCVLSPLFSFSFVSEVIVLG